MCEPLPAALHIDRVSSIGGIGNLPKYPARYDTVVGWFEAEPVTYIGVCVLRTTGVEY